MKCTSFSMPSPKEINELIEFCKVMAASPFYQKLGPGGVLAIYLTAREYDLPVMACLNGGLHTFDGKVTFSAIMIDALILKAGHKTEVLTLTNQSCKIKFIRGDRSNDPSYKPFEYEYTEEMARNAGYLTKNNWKSSPQDMLYCRCLTGGGRKHIPEVFVGVLVSGELVGDNRDGNITPNVPACVATIQTPVIKKEKEIKSIDYEAKKKFLEDFIDKHQLNEENSEKNIFLCSILKKSKKSKDQILEYAISNEERFLNMFEKWKKDNKNEESKIESED